MRVAWRQLILVTRQGGGDHGDVRDPDGAHGPQRWPRPSRSLPSRTHGIEWIEQWAPDRPVAADAISGTRCSRPTVRKSSKLKARWRIPHGAMYVIDVRPETLNLDTMLAKFSREHWHDDDEVRFIVEGRGLFHIRPKTAPVSLSRSKQET